MMNVFFIAGERTYYFIHPVCGKHISLTLIIPHTQTQTPTPTQTPTNTHSRAQIRRRIQPETQIHSYTYTTTHHYQPSYRRKDPKTKRQATGADIAVKALHCHATGSQALRTTNISGPLRKRRVNNEILCHMSI